MLKIIQIIALVQGLFLIVVLLKNRKKYQKATFWLFFGSIISILLFIIGDDENNLFKENADWFLFDSTLFITFFFLFVKYFKSHKKYFEKKDLLFFLPNLSYFIIESIEATTSKERSFIEIPELFLEVVFLGYLIYILIYLFRTKSHYWILYFTVPIVLILSLSFVNEVFTFINFEPPIVFKDKTSLSYLLLVIAFLFYFITFYLINKPKELLPLERQKSYKNSNLNPELVEVYKQQLIQSMEIDRLYEDSKLSIHTVAKKLNVPRQYISEVLNLHLNKSFLDFINEYRVAAFIEKLKSDHYAHFTLLAIANDVGFNSKSSFNATFKKIKGLTPTEFKKSLVK